VTRAGVNIIKTLRTGVIHRSGGRAWRCRLGLLGRYTTVTRGGVAHGPGTATRSCLARGGENCGLSAIEAHIVTKATCIPKAIMLLASRLSPVRSPLLLRTATRCLATTPPPPTTNSTTPDSTFEEYLANTASLSPFVPTPPHVAHLFLESAELSPSDTHVDLGCGRGSFNIAARSVGSPTYGYDSDQELVTHCRASIPEGGFEVIDLSDDAVDWPSRITSLAAANNSTGLVVSCYFVSDSLLTIKPQLTRILRENHNARILCVEYAMEGWEGTETPTMMGLCSHIYTFESLHGGGSGR